MIKAITSGSVIPVLEVLVNQAGHQEEARRILDRLQETARTFLHTKVGCGGFIPFDSSVQQAVIRQTPFLLKSPRCPASRAVEQLARRIKISQSLNKPMAHSFLVFGRYLKAKPREMSSFKTSWKIDSVV